MLVAWATVSVRISGLGMAVKILCLCQIVLNLQSCKRKGQIGPIFIFLWAFFDCNSIPAMERSAGNLDQVWRKLRQNTNSERDIEISHFQPDSQTVQVVRGCTGKVGSLRTHVFETQTAIGREYFAGQDRVVLQISILLISNGEKILSNVTVAM